nr:nucleotide exchange factor GrpE [Clostridium sp.]
MPIEDLSSVKETYETISDIEETEDSIDTIPEEIEEVEGFIDETPEEAEIVEIVEDEELTEILEGEKEKGMRKSKKKLEEENKKLQSEVDAFKDKLLRTTAEYENFRKRTAKEKESIYTAACADVLKEVLPVLDNLERALAIEGSGEELRTGVDMTVRQFTDAFCKLGVEELASKGEFDPNLHNAVMHVEDEQYGDNEIVEVFQKGYKRANKVLRHSMVKVAN